MGGMGREGPAWRRQRGVPRRPGRQSGERARTRRRRRHFQEIPEDQIAHRRQGMAGNQLGLGDDPAAHDRASQQVSEDRRRHQRQRRLRRSRGRPRLSERPTSRWSRSARSRPTGSPANTQIKGENPNFQIGTISGRNWIGRVAARKAIAAAQGLENNEPTRFNLGIYRRFTWRRGADLRSGTGARHIQFVKLSPSNSRNTARRSEETRPENVPQSPEPFCASPTSSRPFQALSLLTA